MRFGVYMVSGSRGLGFGKNGLGFWVGVARASPTVIGAMAMQRI